MRRSALLVEDDEGIRFSLRLLLEDEGIAVREAGDGREAIQILLESGDSPCVVFLDLMMPVMDGVEFLQELHAKYPQLAASIAIVVITAAPLSGERELAVRPFVQEVIRKPFRLGTIVDALHRYCG